MNRFLSLKCATAALFCPLVILASTAFAQNQPQDYALRFALEPLASTGLQRLTLPPDALAALQTSSASDIRIFNSAGQAVPIAMAPKRAAVSSSEPVSWPIYPIMSTTPGPTNPTGMHLRIEESAGRRTVQIDTAKDSATSETVKTAQQIGALVDTKLLKANLAELTVDAQLASGQPVSLSVSASKDLKQWRVLAQDVPVFRFGDNSSSDNAPGSMRVPLNNASVEGEYLRITWSENASFSLRGVTITPAASTGPLPRVALPVNSLVSQSASELIFALPFATPVLALQLRPEARNVLVPLRVSGRSQRGEPWRPLASGVMYRISDGLKDAYSPALELSGLSVRELKIEADKGASGLAGPLPQVTALVAPVELIFITTGDAPFTLAVGRAGTSSVALPIASLIPGYTDGDEEKLAQAQLGKASPTAGSDSAVNTIKTSLDTPSTRSLILWAVLIVGVLVLGAIAWAVSRQLKPPPET
jgi:hypothetical protein